ncbi:hypothetical protein DJ93_4438 [Bacillus clarus]|uniref:Uncharacterized protein n=1 Tax=Bacillus clarus TaxID=2338372 RepID=A0A090YP30_9BACI|nr:hypothetical protein DJ93_4438 [Bacillus clarus]
MERNIKDFVFIGHSFGGTVISKVAEQDDHTTMFHTKLAIVARELVEAEID